MLKNKIKKRIEEFNKLKKEIKEIFKYDKKLIENLTANIETATNQLDWVLSELKEIRCKNCKHLKIWVETKKEKERVYCCNWCECQNIDEDFCNHFEKGENESMK